MSSYGKVDAADGFLGDWATHPKTCRCEDCSHDREVTMLRNRIHELTERNRWISVSERLPDIGQFVTVVCNGIVQYHSAMWSMEGCWYWCDQESDPAPMNEVSHWHPLPDPPEAK